MNGRDTGTWYDLSKPGEPVRIANPALIAELENAT